MFSPSHADATLTIDLAAIAHNYRFFRDKVAPAECSAVVKANAYGLGVEKVAKKLYNEGCKTFFVAHFDEAIEFRSYLPSDKIKLFVLHGIRNGQEKDFLDNNFFPVLNNLEQIEIWNNYATRNKKKLPAIIHVDTGMNRLGISLNDAKKLSENKNLLAGIDTAYVMSHLACADDLNHPKNNDQLEKFRKAIAYLPGIPYSLANSPGCMLDKSYHFQLARPGAGLYGVNTTINATKLEDLKNAPLKNVITLRAKILQIREVDSVQSVGYGATRNVDANSTLAVIPVGYADGYLRSLSSNSYGYIGNVKVPIVGRISMDMIIADVTKVPRNKLSAETEVELIGEKCPVDLVAHLAGTIGYEILTDLGRRYKRVYINE